MTEGLIGLAAFLLLAFLRIPMAFAMSAVALAALASAELAHRRGRARSRQSMLALLVQPSPSRPPAPPDIA